MNHFVRKKCKGEQQNQKKTGKSEGGSGLLIKYLKKNIKNLVKYVKLFNLIIAITFTVGCSSKDGKKLVFVEEIKQPAIINEYKLSAGKKTETGSYYEIQEGTLKGYGINKCGQLGIGTIDDTDTYYENPVTIAEHVIHVDTLGGDFAIYLNNKNELYGMGKNDSGQLGQSIEGKIRLSDECYVSEPVLIMEDVKYAAAGLNFILMLTNTGELYSLGDNLNGQLGDGTAKPVRSERYRKDSNPFSSEPVLIMGKISYIACGLYTAAAIRNDGTLFMWGDNSFGEIGNRTKGNEMPTVSTYVVSEPFKLMEKIKDVHFDNHTVYATTFSGEVYVWGKGYTLSPKKIEN